jgi:hypothetical protein
VKEIRAEAIEEWLAQQLTKITADEALLESAIVAANASASDAAKPLLERRTVVEERLTDVRVKEANLADAIASGGSFEVLKGALASEQAKRHMLENERHALKRQIDALAADPIAPAKGSRSSWEISAFSTRPGRNCCACSSPESSSTGRTPMLS